jgi:hypothetical protein
MNSRDKKIALSTLDEIIKIVNGFSAQDKDIFWKEVENITETATTYATKIAVAYASIKLSLEEEG